MSAPYYSPNGAVYSLDVSVCGVRWGGGADHGKYHVFLTGAVHRFFTYSRQCVVDDFGDLVPVDGGAA